MWSNAPVRNFDDIPSGVMVRREVTTHQGTPAPQQLQYNWQEHFNNGLVVVFGVVKLLLGMLLIVCGVMAFVYKAYYYSVAGAIWFGIMVVFAGLFGTLTHCVRQSLNVFLYMVMSLVCIVGGAAFCVMLALGAWNDSENSEADAWGCAYDLVDVCDAYSQNRDAMVIINAIASAVSFLVMFFGILGLVMSLQPWVECLRTTNPCCDPKDSLCFCCCFTPDETKQAYGQPSQLYSAAGTGPYAKSQPARPTLTYGQARPVPQPSIAYGQAGPMAQPYVQQAAIPSAQVAYQQNPMAISYQ